MEVEGERVSASGPSLPRWTGSFVRVLQVAALALTVAWALGPLGGVSLSPDEGPTEGSNSTSRLFNWHPILMVFGYVVCMGEALSAYAAPALPGGATERPARKAYHAALHSLALVAAGLGLVAALLSHSLARPTPIPDFYSAHSVVGLVALFCFLAQARAGWGKRKGREREGRGWKGGGVRERGEEEKRGREPLCEGEGRHRAGTVGHFARLVPEVVAPRGEESGGGAPGLTRCECRPDSIVRAPPPFSPLVQAVIGFCAYVYPQASQSFRERFGFSHRFFGLFTFAVGVAAAMLGAQEKATFLQLGAKKGVRSAAVALPALLQPLLIAVAGAVVLRVAVARAAASGRKEAPRDERAPLFGRRGDA